MYMVARVLCIITSQEGKTALISACLAGHLNVVKALLAAVRCDIYATDNVSCVFVECVDYYPVRGRGVGGDMAAGTNVGLKLRVV